MQMALRSFIAEYSLHVVYIKYNKVREQYSQETGNSSDFYCRIFYLEPLH